MFVLYNPLLSPSLHPVIQEVSMLNVRRKLGSVQLMQYYASLIHEILWHLHLHMISHEPYTASLQRTKMHTRCMHEATDANARHRAEDLLQDSGHRNPCTQSDLPRQGSVYDVVLIPLAPQRKLHRLFARGDASDGQWYQWWWRWYKLYQMMRLIVNGDVFNFWTDDTGNLHRNLGSIRVVIALLRGGWSLLLASHRCQRHAAAWNIVNIARGNVPKYWKSTSLGRKPKNLQWPPQIMTANDG